MQSFIACYVNCYLYYDRNGARKSYRGDDFEQEKERGEGGEGGGGREREKDFASILFIHPPVGQWNIQIFRLNRGTIEQRSNTAAHDLWLYVGRETIG